MWFTPLREIRWVDWCQLAPGITKTGGLIRPAARAQRLLDLTVVIIAGFHHSGLAPSVLTEVPASLFAFGGDDHASLSIEPQSMPNPGSAHIRAAFGAAGTNSGTSSRIELAPGVWSERS